MKKFLVVSIFLFSGHAFSQTTYPMHCKTGSNTQVLTVTEAAQFYSAIHLGFKKSAHAAKDKPPLDGECTWWDRPISAAEPSRILFPFLCTRAMPQFMPESKIFIMGWFMQNGCKEQILQNLVTKIVSGGVFQFQTYNDTGLKVFRAVNK